MQKIVEYEGAELELATATYGDRLTRSALIRRFTGADENASDDDNDLRIARYNYIMVGTHTRRAKKVQFVAPRRAMSEAEFEQAFEAFLSWPDGLVTRAIEALDELLTPNQDKATLPPEHLSEEELTEKN